MDSALTIEDAQFDLRRAFVGGGPGLVISGLFWLTAGLVASTRGVGPAFVLLFITGMLIFPLGTLVRRWAFGRQPAATDNPMGRIALESTFTMIAGLIVAWLILPLRPDWVFPIAAIAVGTHFFAFRSAYGDILYWVLAALMTALAFAELFGQVKLGNTLLFVVAAMEISFGLWITQRELRTPF